jgi:hypothetical protein
VNAKATADAQATAEAGATSTAVAQVTATREAANITATANQADRQTKTAVAIAQKTAVAKPMLDLLDKLVADGHLTGTAGKYMLLPDFSEGLAMLNFIAPYPAMVSPKNFVLRTDLAWESASKTADWNASACGFIFHVGKDGSFYSASLALDGYVQMTQHKPNYSYVTDIGKGYYGKLDVPKGSAKFVLVVTIDQITVFINDKMVKSFQSNLLYTSGGLSYSITSGTNKDFGMRCTMTNIELWELED